MRNLLKICFFTVLGLGIGPSEALAKKASAKRKPASTTVNSELKRTQILIEKSKEEIDEANPEIETIDFNTQSNFETPNKPELTTATPTYEQDNRIGYNLENKTADALNRKLLKKQIDDRNRANYRRAVRKQFELNAEANGVDPKSYSGDIEKDLEKLEKSK